MKKQAMDPKQLKLLKAAIVKLREVKNIMDKININSAVHYDCRVLSFSYDNRPTDGDAKINIHLDSLTTLKQLYKGIEPGKPCGKYKELHHQSGDVKAFCLFAEEEEE